MSLGVIAAIISALFWGVANMLMKKQSTAYTDNHLALVFQYSAMAIMALGIGALRAFFHETVYIPYLSREQRLLILSIGTVGYLGIMLLFEAFDRLSAWISLIIANLATCIMYFLNLFLYPGEESFSISKIILAVIFFCIIAIFLLKQDSSITKTPNIQYISRNKNINLAMVFPLGTALCRSLFFVGNNYLIKESVLSPVQSGMLTETSIFVVALLRYTIAQTPKKAILTIQYWLTTKGVFIFLWIGILNTLSVYLLYFGYQYTSANLINVIKLFAIPVTALCARMFLKDKLTTMQTTLLIISLITIISFIFI